jgi:hypothetical protein
MAKEIVKASSSEMTTYEKNVYEAYADAVDRNRIVGELLKFSKGEWLAGRDGVEVREGTEFVAACHLFEIGWIRWYDGKPTESRMGRLGEGFVAERRVDLGDHNQDEWEFDERSNKPRDPWQASNVLFLMTLEDHQIFTYPSSSKGGIAALGKLMGAYGKHVRQKPDELPIVAIGVDSYRHPDKTLGKIFTPTLPVVGWAKRKAFDDALAALEQASETVEEEKEPEEEAAEKPNAYAAAKAGEPVKRGPGRPPGQSKAARGKAHVPF